MTLGIDADITCIQCGYNLRTLAHNGQCPECGSEIAPSVARYELNLSRINIGRCGRRRILDWIESIVCLLLSCAIITAVVWWGFAPYYSPQRKIGLYAVCTAWVLSGFGVWKSAAADPIADDDARKSRLRLLRICICIYIATPAVLFARDWIPIEPFDAFLLVVCLIAGLIAVVQFYGRLAYLSYLCDRPRWQKVFEVFQWLSPLAAIGLVLLGTNGRRNSLETTLTLPSLGYQFGLIFGALPDFLRAGRWDMNDLIFGALLLAAFVELASRVFLLLYLIRARWSIVE